MTVLEKPLTTTPRPKYPGVLRAMDGTDAVVAMETAASEAAGAYPITPSTQMGEGWALAAARGELNVHGRRLIFFEPEGEHAAAAVTAGMAMTGLRSANFSSGQGIAYMHESLYAAVGKRLTYVLNMACRAMTKHALNVHAGHDDYHAIDDTGFFQLFAKNAQEAADLNLIAHRIAELSLNPGVCAQDGFLTSHVIESILLPERELVREYLGDPADRIECPTPAQRLVFGPERRRIPEMFDVDQPVMLGVVQNQDSYAQGVAAQRPFFFDHIAELADRAMAELAELTGRRYARATGYRTDDAEWILVGQGTVVGNAEAVADHLRETRGLPVGVVNVTMFRPFPADLVSRLLRGAKGCLVLERVDQPLAADPPLLREIRGALSQAMENHRVDAGQLPYPKLASCAPDEVPDFYSGCYGLGSRDLQAENLLAAVENMLPGGGGRRQFYLGIDFVRPGAAVGARPESAGAADGALEAYPDIAGLALSPAEPVNLLPEGSTAVRIHSVGGWGAITMGKNLTHTLFQLLGLQVKSNPKYGSEKKGQPTTFYGVFAHEPIRINCELKRVDVVLSPDPNVFRHSNPLDGLAEEGVFVIQSRESGAAVWHSFPAWAQRIVRRRRIRVFAVDAFAIARAETDVDDLQYRMQGAAFQGAFFKTSRIMEREELSEGDLFAAIRDQLEKKFGHRGRQVVDDNERVIRRGYDEVAEIDWRSLEDTGEEDDGASEVEIPWYLDRGRDTSRGLADPFRFAESVCGAYGAGEDPLADPFAAFSAIPAATGVFRDMTGIRFEVPELIAERCTGCGQCWTQCPDAAIPGLVVEVDQVLRAAATENGGPGPRLAEALPKLSRLTRDLLRENPDASVPGAVARAFETLAPRLDLDRLEASEREVLDAEVDAMLARLREMPVAVTAPFFTVPERREEGSGGLLMVTVNPYACKGCNLCVEVCPDDALISVRQTEEVVEGLKERWSVWEDLPDTPDRFLQVSDLDEGIGVLHTLLLKKKIYHSMVGGDGSCMGCGEKTAVHLITGAIEAAIRPKAAAFVEKLERLTGALEEKVQRLVVAASDLDEVAVGETHLDVSLPEEERRRVGRIHALVQRLKELHWRYTSGPSGRGRAALGIANSTGCSSVWGSTYPYNPYPYPWTNHLFQDAPSIAIGLFEGLMRRMADGFAAVRKAELELDDAWDPAVHERFFDAFDWEGFTDEELELCPPMLVVGGDGAMLDIGFQNVSRLMASGKPLRVVVLDTQVYSNTGGQACTSGFHGQVSDMAAFGAARHGKAEHRKEMALIAMAHRNTYVLQSSQALPAHLMAGVLRGLQARRPAIFNIYTPCQAEHGLPDHGSARAAKMALEGRAFAHLVYDPDAGDTFPERLSLEGNPALGEAWPSYELSYRDDDGRERTMTVPMTTADWAATEPRFKPHFRPIPRSDWDDAGLVPFHEYLELTPAERAEADRAVPYILVLDAERRLSRLRVSPEMVDLTEERARLWDELRELAGVRVPDSVAASVRRVAETEFESRLAELEREYEGKIAELKEKYPALITRKIAQALVAGGAGLGTDAAAVSLGLGRESGPVRPVAPAVPRPATAATTVATPAAEPTAAPPPDEAKEPAAEPESAASAAETSDDLGMDAWIETALCTSCDECIRINPDIFAYNDDKQAYVKNPAAGSFEQIVKAAEKCTARIIHPGTPKDPNEPNLEKWVARAEAFQ